MRYADLFAARTWSGCGSWPPPPAATTRSAGFVTCSSSRSTGCSGLETRARVRGAGRARGLARGRPGRRAGPVPRGRRSSRPTSRTPDRRAALEEARNAVLAERLNPLHRAALERAHELCRALGWPSYAAAYAELRGIDLEALARQTAPLPRGHRGAPTRRSSIPSSGARECAPLGELRRCDLPRFFRAADLDPVFPADRLVDSFARHARRARHRPGTPGQRPPRHRVAPDQVAARLLLDAARSRRDLPGDRADGRAGRLRRALPRGRPRRALREHRPRPGVRVPASRRQLGDRVVRVPARAPDRGPRLASRPARAWRIPSPRSLTRAPSSWCSLRRYAAKLALRAGAARRLGGARRDARSLRGAAHRGAPRSVAAGELAGRRRRRLLRCLLPAGVGARDAVAGRASRAVRARLVRLARGGRVAARAVAPRASGSTPTSCSPRRSAESSTSRCWPPSSSRRPTEPRATSAGARSPRARSFAPCRASRACAPAAARPGSGRRSRALIWVAVSWS